MIPCLSSFMYVVQIIHLHICTECLNLSLVQFCEKNIYKGKTKQRTYIDHFFMHPSFFQRVKQRKMVILRSHPHEVFFFWIRPS